MNQDLYWVFCSINGRGWPDKLALLCGFTISIHLLSFKASLQSESWLLLNPEKLVLAPSLPIFNWRYTLVVGLVVTESTTNTMCNIINRSTQHEGSPSTPEHAIQISGISLTFFTNQLNPNVVSFFFTTYGKYYYIGIFKSKTDLSDTLLTTSNFPRQRFQFLQCKMFRFKWRDKVFKT